MPVSFVCIVTSRNSSEHSLHQVVQQIVMQFDVVKVPRLSVLFFFKQLTFTEKTARPGVSEFGIVFSSQFSNSRLCGMQSREVKNMILFRESFCERLELSVDLIGRRWGIQTWCLNTRSPKAFTSLCSPLATYQPTTIKVDLENCSHFNVVMSQNTSIFKRINI